MITKEEFEELKRRFKGASLLTKTFILVSLFLTVSSITSLSDVVFEWKGFIKNGLEFYREWITGSIIRLFKPTWFSGLTHPECDMLVVISVCLGTYARFGFISGATMWGCASLLFFGPALVMSVMEGNQNTIGFVVAVQLAPCSLAVGYGVFKRDRAKFWSGLGFPVAVIAIVLTLGAINAGLTRAS